MNIKYIKASVIIMTVILVLGIPILIIGFIQKSEHPDLVPIIGAKRTNYTKSPNINDMEDASSTQNSVANDVSNVHKISTPINAYADIKLNIPKNFKCQDPYFNNSGMTSIHCFDKKSQKHRIITLNLYNGTVVGQIDY